MDIASLEGRLARKVLNAAPTVTPPAAPPVPDEHGTAKMRMKRQAVQTRFGDKRARRRFRGA